MFKTITRTWNPFTGCKFNCTYCWARKLAEGRLKSRTRKYTNGFEPTFHPMELTKKFYHGEFIFVCSMGDISWATRDEIGRIRDYISLFPNTRFLIQSKALALLFGNCFPSHITIGTTIETNRDSLAPQFSKAPKPSSRLRAIKLFRNNPRFISIEPIIDFDLNIFISWIVDIQPDIVEIGADNYKNNLPEPSPDKLKALLDGLRAAKLNVIEKDGLERLK